MLNNIISLIIRGGITFGIGFLIGAGSDVVLAVGDTPSLVIASIVWIIGGIYSLSNFNDPYNFIKITSTENKISEIIDSKNKQKIEEEMLRVKKLLDNDILTKDEYDHKIKVLKSKYL